MPKAVYHSGYCDKHYRLWRDWNLGPLTPQSDALTTRPAQTVQDDIYICSIITTIIAQSNQYLLLLKLDIVEGVLNVRAHFSCLTMTGGSDVTCIHAGLPGTTACEVAASTGKCCALVATAGVTSTVGWLTAGKAAVAAGVNEI